MSSGSRLRITAGRRLARCVLRLVCCLAGRGRRAQIAARAVSCRALPGTVLAAY